MIAAAFPPKGATLDTDFCVGQQPTRYKRGRRREKWRPRHVTGARHTISRNPLDSHLATQHKRKTSGHTTGSFAKEPRETSATAIAPLLCTKILYDTTNIYKYISTLHAIIIVFGAT